MTRNNNKEAAFKRLVEQHMEMVVNTCYRFVMNREDAEDIAQEVFIEMHRSLDSFREESKLSTWIYRIAVTKSLDHLRYMKRKKRFSSLKRLIGMEGEEDPTENLPDVSQATPHEVMEQAHRAELLQRALDSLPEAQKAALLLSKQDGYGNQEIAEILGTSISAVESLIHRAKKTLHKKLYDKYSKE
uniref:RNA polymerase, sigma subunit, ECF family n=1 Tax=Chlorobium chlorochromatii (strain CaD3) TaxID=340177 RepID=Q3ATC9_CHLCH